VIRSQAVPEAENLPPTVVRRPRREWTEMDWEISPPAHFQMLCRLEIDYHPRQLYITENGASYSDGPDASGRVADQRRLDYLRRHLAACHQAIEAGVPLAGYFAWSLLDNFEWARGYAQRFGLVYVDYATQRRYPKDSALWFAAAAARNGFELPEGSS
jgi:beta-glucosidase